MLSSSDTHRVVRDTRTKDASVEEAYPDTRARDTNASAQVPGKVSCWICLEETSDENPTFAPCKCPCYVHAQCLGVWQLTSAGKT